MNRADSRRRADYCFLRVELRVEAFGIDPPCPRRAIAEKDAIDPEDCNLHAFLVELAGALATLPDDEIESATGVDVTYRAGADSSIMWSTSPSGLRTNGRPIQAGKQPRGFRLFCPGNVEHTIRRKAVLVCGLPGAS